MFDRIPKRVMPISLLACAALLLPLAAAAADITSHWDLAGSGSWETDTNWSPIGAPDNSGGNFYYAILDYPGPVQVTVNTTVNIDSLFVDAEDEVQVANSRNLYISAANGRLGVENRGIIRLNAVSTWTYLRLVDGPIRLTGGGEIFGTGGTSFANVTGTAGETLINVDNTFRGAMYLGYNQLAIENHGTIQADDPLDELFLDPHADGMINTGMIRAQDGAVLQMATGDYDNTGGTIEAIDGGAIQLTGTVNITGGTLQTTDGSEIVAIGGAPSITDLANLGRLRADNGDLIYASGAISNQDTILLDALTTWTYLRTRGGPVTLSGGGTLRGGGRYAQIGTVDASRLTNVDNTISGAGYLGYNQMGLTNQATIVADNPSWPLIIDPSVDGVINTGLMRAENGAVMELNTGDFDNTGGVIEAVDGASVEILGTVNISGGTLQTANGGKFLLKGGAPEFADLTSLGRVHVDNGDLLYVSGAISNQDTIHLDALTTWTYLRTRGGTVTLSGGGVIRGGVRYAQIAGTDGSRLINQDNTIGGAIYLGYNQIGITNAGTIQADDDTWPMILDPSDDGFLNTGTVSVTGAAGLDIGVGPFEQQGVFEVAAGSTAEHDDDFIQTAGTTTIDGVLDMGSADTVELQGGIFGGEGQVIGDFNNTGGTVAPGGAPGVLSIDGDYTQTLGATLAVDIDGTTPGTGHDVLAITGDAAVAGEVDVTFLGGYSLAVDDTFVVLTAASVSGELTIAPGGSFPPGILPWVAVRETDVVVTIEQISITGAEDPEDALPVVRPLTVSPNPSPGGRVNIDFALADKSAEAKVVIYDVVGRRVRELNTGLQGGARLTWNGRGDNGRPVSAGIYFVRVQARNGHDEVKRVTVVR